MKLSVIVCCVLSALAFAGSQPNYTAVKVTNIAALPAPCSGSVTTLHLFTLFLFSGGVLFLALAVSFQFLDVKSETCNVLHILLGAAALWVFSVLAFCAICVIRAAQTTCREWVWKLQLIDSVAMLVIVGTFMTVIGPFALNAAKSKVD